MSAIASAQVSSTMRRFSFKVGVSMPLSTVKSSGMIRNFRTFSYCLKLVDWASSSFWKSSWTCSYFTSAL